MQLSRNRNYNILWSSQLLSELALEIAAVAVLLLVLARSGSPLQTGLASSALAAAHMVAVVPAGVLADRWDRRRLMLVCQVLRLLGAASLAGALALDVYAFWHVLLFVVLEGLLGSVFDPAEHAALAQVVPRPQLSSAVARNAARPYIASLLGPAAAGLLFGAAPGGPFVANTAMLAVSAVALVFLRMPRHRPAAAAREGGEDPSAGGTRSDGNDGTARGFLAGFRWIVAQPVLRVTMGWLTVTNLAFGALVFVLLARSDEGRAGPGEIGLTMACFGAGGLLGGLAAPSLHARVRAPVAVLVFTWVAAAAGALMAAVPPGLPMGVLLGAAAFFAPLAYTTVLTHQLLVTPGGLRGRTSGVAGFCTGGAGALGPALGGGLMSSAGSGVTALLLCAGGLALVAVVATASPTLRRFPDAHGPISRSEQGT